MANKRKILDNARKLAQKGAKEKALKEYQKLLKLDPADAKLRLEIGDAHRRWGQIEQAIATYEAVASQYAKEGFDARAVAVYKQIVTLDSEYYAAYAPLAEIYERMGLAGEAMLALQTAADGLNREGQKNKALDLLRKMATMDPTNTTSRMKVAELLRQEGRDAEALAEYESAARELERQGDLEGAGRAFVAVLELSPDHLGATKGVTRSMMAQNAPDKAVACARRLLKLAPEDESHYEILANALRAAGQENELSAVYHGLADLYRQRGDEDRAREITQRYVSPDELAMEPASDAGTPEDLSDVVPDSIGDEFLDVGPGLGEDLLDDEVDFEEEVRLENREVLVDELIEDDEAISAVDLEDPIGSDTTQPGGPSPLEVRARPAAPTAVERKPEPPPATAVVPPDADPDQLLAEASVYLRYGKQDRAISHLEAVLEQDPQHRAALEKLGEACVEVGDPQRAVQVWTTAAHCARQEEDQDAFELLRARIGAIDAEAAERLAPEPPPAASDPSPDATGEIEVDFDLDADEEVEISDELSFEQPAALEAPPTQSGPGASVSSTTSQQIADDLEEADFYVQQELHEEAEAIYKRVLAVAPSHPTALVRLGELAAAKGGDPSRPDSDRASSPTATAATDALAVAAEASVDTTAEMEVDLDDSDFIEEGDLDGSTSEVTIDFEEPEVEPVFELESDPAFAGPLAASPEEVPAVLDVEEELSFDDEDPLAASLSAAFSEEPFADAPEPPVAPEPASEPLVEPALEAIPEPAFEEPERPGAQELGVPVPPTADDTLGDGVDLVAEIGGFEDDEPVEELAKEPDDSFDLAAELSDALGDSMSGASGAEGVDDGFSAVFSAFKKGVSETLQEGDHQAHYDLGIAYKEMGLFDDAISELRLAIEDEARRPECLHLMGLCALDGGDPAAAVEHLKELLDCPDVPDEAALAAQYDIARAYTDLGNLAQARLAYQSVQALDASFRDVATLLAALDAPPDPAPEVEAEAPATADDGLESFEDFLDDEDDDEIVIDSGEAVCVEPLPAEEPPAVPPPLPSAAPAAGFRLDASALAEAAAESELDAPIVMEGLDEEDEELEEVSEHDVATDEVLVIPPPESPPVSPRRRKKKISFV